MSETFRWLLSVDNSLPKGDCLVWQPAALWLNVGSDALIAGAYFVIAAAFYCVAQQILADVRRTPLPLVFTISIFLCGLNHAMSGLTVWFPVYRAAGILKLLAAVFAILALLKLMWIMPRALHFRVPGAAPERQVEHDKAIADLQAQLHAANAAHRAAEQRLEVSEHEHARSTALLTTILESAPSLIYAKDRDGRMLLANPPALKLIGKSWPEVQGRTDLEFLDDASQAQTVVANDRRLMEANHTEELEEAVGTVSGEERIWFSIKAPLRNPRGAVIGLVGVSIEITERKRLEHRLRLMVDELNHRAKNTLATAQAIATQTLRGANPQLFDAFEGRLLALAAAHDVLTRENWTGALLNHVILSQVTPHGGARCHVSGPRLRLSSSAALALAMGMHELATNALKHGALSNDVGRVIIEWEITPDVHPLLKVTWTERDGPRVTAPHSQGFGSRMIERSLARDLGGRVLLRFDDPEGVVCEIEAPLAQTSAPANVLPFPQIGSMLGSAT